MQYLFDALEGTREACSLGELHCRRPILTDTVPSPRRVLRPDAPVECSSFGLDKFWSHFDSGLQKNCFGNIDQAACFDPQATHTFLQNLRE